MGENATSIKVIIADDHELIREGFRFMLKKQVGIELIGEAADGEQLLLLAKELEPDIIIMDIKMPKLNGIQATKQIVAEYPDIGIIALSFLEEQYLVDEIIKAGARGYIIKNSPNSEIISAIQAVYNHQGIYYYPQNAGAPSKTFRRTSHVAFPLKKLPTFNRSEIAIMKLICKELTNKEIASELNLSVRTIEDYRERIIEKIDAKNSTGIVLFAIRNNIYLP